MPSCFKVLIPPPPPPSYSPVEAVEEEVHVDGYSFSFETILHISPSSFPSFFLLYLLDVIRTFSKERYSFISSFEYVSGRTGARGYSSSLKRFLYPLLHIPFFLPFFFQIQRYLQL